tara:strand:+ start:463 stop:609 length:147 start_codon:yes stop_codon:yes gene_type:complete
MEILRKEEVLGKMLTNIKNFAIELMLYIGEQVYEINMVCPLEDVMCME